MNPPDWLYDYAHHAREALGLHAWEIKLSLSDVPDPDNPDADATTYADPSYLFARIKFRLEHMGKETPGGKVLVVHELLHVQEAAQDVATERVIDHLVPRKHRTLAHELLTKENEERVVRLSRQLYELIEPGWRKAKKQAKKAKRDR